jgi:hypothetical protein
MADPVTPTERPAIVVLKKALAFSDRQLDDLVEAQVELEQRIVSIRLDVAQVNEQRVDLLAALEEVTGEKYERTSE